MASFIQTFMTMYISLCSLWTFSGSSVTNVTERYSTHDDFFNKHYLKQPHYLENRQPHGRIFQVVNKDSKIRLELSFAIPFVEIPVPGSGKYSDYASGNTDEAPVQFNLGALTSAGILASAALIFVPKIFTGLGPQVNIGRSADDNESTLSKVFSRIERELQTHDIDSSICTQRAMCWLVKSASSKVLHGRGDSMDKIIDGITSNHWLQSIVNGTALQEAMDVGRRNENCHMVYTKCHITERRLHTAFMQFMADD